MLVGPPKAVFPALARWGWHATQRLTMGSIGQTIPSALFGRHQDIALPKSRSDVNQRNHMWLGLTSRPLRYHHVATRWPAPRQKQPGLRACPDLSLHC